MRNDIRRTLSVLTLALAAPLAAEAAVEYYKWTTVTLPASSGATCGNGTPARVLVNRTPNTTKTLVYFEGGGACWDQNACLGKGKLTEVASNANGVPEDYFSQANAGIFGIATPLITRTPLFGKIFTQDWNIVYVPYCTGDVHAGSTVKVYDDADKDKPLVYHHAGYLNGKAVAAWMKANMPQPEVLLVSGSSAGGVGATANYGWLRRELNPKQGVLAADSGPLFPAPRGASADQYPSLPLQEKVRQSWGVDGPNGIATELISLYPQAGDVNHLATLYTGLPKVFPKDRFGYMMFQSDGIFSAFSYTKFYPDIRQLTGTAKDAALNKLWRKDVANFTAFVKDAPNTGYYLPEYRPFLKSHTLLLLDFTGTAIEESKIASVGTFLENLVDTSKPVMRAVEKDQVSDRYRIFSVNPIQWIVALFEGVFA